MRVVRFILRIALEYTSGSLLLFGAIGLVDGFFNRPSNAPIRVTLALTLAVFYVLLIHFLARPAKQERELVVNSPKFIEFYRRWYLRPGVLHVYCADLHWLEDARLSPIVEALRLKGQQGHIYVKDRTGTVAESLRTSGVNFYDIPGSVRLDVKLSMVIDDEYKSVIVRNKVTNRMDSKRSKNRFRETTDEYTTGIGQEFLELIRTNQ